MADTLIKLSGSTDGQFIKITAVATPGTTVHAAHATSLDIISLWAVNQDADGETRTLTVEWGNTTDPWTVTVPPKAGPVFICDRLPLTNSLVVKAFADEASDVYLNGLVVRSS